MENVKNIKSITLTKNQASIKGAWIFLYLKINIRLQ